MGVSSFFIGFRLADRAEINGAAQMGLTDQFPAAPAFPDDKKPSPLTDAFDERYFEQLCSASPKNLSLKALLATEQRIRYDTASG